MKISRAEIERGSAITRIMIALRMADYECTEGEASKVFDALQEEDSDLNDENIVAAFEDLNLECEHDVK